MAPIQTPQIALVFTLSINAVVCVWCGQNSNQRNERLARKLGGTFR